MSSEKRLRITGRLNWDLLSIIRALCPDSQKRISEVYPHAFPLCDFLLIRLSSIITLPQQHHQDPRTAEVDPRYQPDLPSHPFSPKCPAVIKPWDTAEQFQLRALPRALMRQLLWEKEVIDCSPRLQDLVSLDLAPSWISSAAWNIPMWGFLYFLFLPEELFCMAIAMLGSPEQRKIFSGFIYMSVPPWNTSPAQIFQSSSAVSDLETIKSSVFFSFYRRWFIIVVQLFFQLELKFIMVGFGFFWLTSLFKGTSIYWILKHWRTLMYSVLFISVLPIQVTDQFLVV